VEFVDASSSHCSGGEALHSTTLWFCEGLLAAEVARTQAARLWV